MLTSTVRGSLPDHFWTTSRSRSRTDHFRTTSGSISDQFWTTSRQKPDNFWSNSLVNFLSTSGLVLVQSTSISIPVHNEDIVAIFLFLFYFLGSAFFWKSMTRNVKEIWKIHSDSRFHLSMKRNQHFMWVVYIYI